MINQNLLSRVEIDLNQVRKEVLTNKAKIHKESS